MKRILIVLLIVTLLLCGCGKKETEEAQQRFVTEYHQTFGAVGNLYIIRDTETGKTYLFGHSGYAGGLTMLEDGECLDADVVPVVRCKDCEYYNSDKGE